MKIKLLPEFVRPEHPCVSSSWVASRGGTLTPSQLKAGEAAFLGMKASLRGNASQLQDQATSDQTSPLHRRAFTQVSCPHLHELCHINTCRVTDKSWGDLYLLAHTQCTPGEYMYKTGDSGLWVTTHLLVHRNCLCVCLRSPQHADGNSSYPSHPSFSAHWAGDSATSCFIILAAFQKK